MDVDADVSVGNHMAELLSLLAQATLTGLSHPSHVLPASQALA
jgi:hypothetical protein